jgi:hypothetical protein
MNISEYDVECVQRGLHSITFRMSAKHPIFYFWLGIEAEAL